MAPSRRRGSSKAASSVAAAAAAKKKVWKVGDLVLAKVKGFPAWPATVSEPEKWGYSTDWKKVLVYFFGTKQIAFCNPGDVEAFTEEKKKSLLSKRHGKGADFVRAVQEIVDSYEKAKAQELEDDVNSGDEYTISNAEIMEDSKGKMGNGRQPQSIMPLPDSRMESLCVSTNNNESHHLVDVAEMENGGPDDMDIMPKEQVERAPSFDHLMETRLVTSGFSRKRLIDAPLGSCVVQKRTVVRRSRSTVKVEPCKLRSQRLPLKDNSTVAGDVPPNGARNESAKRSKRIRKSPGNSVWYHMDSPGYSAAFASNASAEDNESEIGATNSDSVSFSGGNTLDSSCKSEHNGIECLDQGVQLSDMCHFPSETSVLKKKRKPNRKRANHGTVVLNASPDRSPALSIPVEGIVPHSPNACELVFDPLSKANGDEHLPLVKRARVRMGKPPLEEKQLNESSREDSVTTEQLLLLSLSCGNNLHNVNGSSATSGNTQEPKEPIWNANTYQMRASVDGSLATSGNTLEPKEPIWNANTYQMRASVDGESALPPSKRLHRALKAMSANAAEEDQNFIDAQGASKASVGGCSDSSDKSSSHTSVDNEVGSVSEVQNANSFGDDDSNINDESETPPGLISRTSEILEKASPEPKSCDHLIEVSKSSKSDDCKVSVLTFENFVEATHVDNSSLNIHSDVAKITIKSPHPSSVVEQKQSVLGSGLAEMDPSSPSVTTVKLEVRESSHGTCEDTQEDKSVQDRGIIQPNHHGQHSSEVDEGRSSQGVDDAHLSVVNVDCVENKHSLMSPSDKNVQAMCEIVKEDKSKSEEKDTDLNSMKILIAAAQAKRELSISNSFSDNVHDDKAVCDSVSSPSSVRKIGALDQASPPSPTLIHLPVAGSKTQLTRNGSMDFPRGKKSIRLPEMDDPTTSSSSQRHKSSGKWANVEANAVRKSFESILGTLSRTKESIGRATRLAIDCAKHGIAAEVLEILIQNLETGTSLHKKVDLFFLVDSITQCSRGQKGDIGDIYPSLVQRMLPRLLSATAPPGHAARENRKQCLKVLRLWLERKTLPDSVICHHMRELESAEASYTMVHGRRPLRMERALDDPIREMEGMHVDEYGSNASFQLPGLSMPPMLEDEEGSDAEDKSFEAVTPEQDPETPAEREVTPTSTFEKHCHILEDVDGELEMEDVAPSYEMVKSSANEVPAVDDIGRLHNQFEHHPLSYAPPLPEDCPPPPPPLPASPPPVVPLPPVPSQPVRCHSFTGIVDSKYHPHSMQSTSQQHMPQQLDVPIMSSVRSDTEHYYAQGCRDTEKQPIRPGSFSNTSSSCKTPAHRPPVHMGSNIQHIDHGPVHSKSYQLQPPPPTLSNQFSYVHDDHRRLSWMEASSSSFPKRYRYGFDMHREDMYENRDRMDFTPHEVRERCRIDAPVHSVPMQSHNPEAAYARTSQYGPPEEPTRMLDRGWSFPPRTLNYHNPRPFRPPEAPRFWRPR